jgi:hypothetical protein
VKLAYTPAWHPEAGAIAHDEHGRMVYHFSPPSVQDESCNDPPMPRNLVMVMDKSAWMRGTRLKDVKRVFLSLLSVNGSMKLQPKDVLSIHTFAKLGTESSWGPMLMTAENRASAIAFVQAIDFGVYLDEITPRYVPRNLHDAYIHGLKKLDMMMQRKRVEPGIDFDGSMQKRCEKSFGVGCTDVNGVPMMMLVTAGRPTIGVRDPEHFAYNIRTNNTVDAKIVTVALGEPLDEHVIAQIRQERAEINGEIARIHQQMAPRQGYTLDHISPKDRRVFVKRLEGWDGKMDLTGEFLDLELLELMHRHTCGKLAHIREERPDTVDRMVKFLETELATPLLFNLSVTEIGRASCRERVY